MAELIVKGFATKDVVCDWVTYIFDFKKKAGSISEAIELVNSEIEKFLSIMEISGIEPTAFVTGTMRAEEKYRSCDEEAVLFEASKDISLSTELRLENSNAISQIITENKIDVRYTEMHNPRGLDEIHKELLRLAMEDSKSKAEMIAACAGKKVIGIVRVDANSQEHEKEWAEKYRADFSLSATSLQADKLQMDTSEEKEEIEVVWLIES